MCTECSCMVAGCGERQATCTWVFEHLNSMLLHTFTLPLWGKYCSCYATLFIWYLKFQNKICTSWKKKEMSQCLLCWVVFKLFGGCFHWVLIIWDHFCAIWVDLMKTNKLALPLLSCYDGDWWHWVTGSARHAMTDDRQVHFIKWNSVLKVGLQLLWRLGWPGSRVRFGYLLSVQPGNTKCQFHSHIYVLANISHHKLLGHAVRLQ